MLKILKLLYKLFGVLNVILMIGDIYDGYYDWALISAVIVMICYFVTCLLNSVE